jgi:ferredoxin, 2Fe-2S
MRINVETRKGQLIEVDGQEGSSVMEAIRNAGIDEIQALCGGQLTCATCHIYVDNNYFDLLPPMDPHEEDMLETSDHLKRNSRLACQVPCSEKLSGIRVVIAPKD